MLLEGLKNYDGYGKKNAKNGVFVTVHGFSVERFRIQRSTLNGEP